MGTSTARFSATTCIGAWKKSWAGRQSPTQYGRVLEELGIESIRALSAQGKGRIERISKTFQDRLRSELRLAQAKTLAEANTVWQAYIGGAQPSLCGGAEGDRQRFPAVQQESEG